MAIREQNLYKVWDGKVLIKENIDYLLKRTHPITFPLNNESKQIIKDLEDTYVNIPCAGIAANQIGYNARMFIGMEFVDEETVEDDEQNIDEVIPKEDNMEIYINPKIIKSSLSSMQTGFEGCLSIPEIQLEVIRHDNIKVSYQNREGLTITKKMAGFLSRLFQHELDHLDGKLMIQKMNDEELKAILQDEKYEPLIKELKNYTR